MNRIVVILFSLSLLLACDKKDEKNTADLMCQKFAVEDGNRYSNETSAQFGIDTAYFDGMCLNVRIGASGCSGETWEVNLIDAGAVMESNPIQRNIRFTLKNEELCLAYFEKTYTFDMQPIIGDYNDKILFNLSDWSGTLLYE